MIQNIYYIVASLGIIFTGFMGFLTYKLNKDTKRSEERTKKVAEEIKNIYETNNKNRNKSETIIKLLQMFSSLDAHLKDLNQNDESIVFLGITIENTVDSIATIVLEISEYSFVFTDSNQIFDTGSYSLIDTLSSNHDESNRKSIAKSALQVNAKHKSFLRGLQKDM